MCSSVERSLQSIVRATGAEETEVASLGKAPKSSARLLPRAEPERCSFRDTEKSYSA